MIRSRLIVGGLAAAILACASAVQAAGPVQTACATDFQKACPDAKPGPGGGLGQCVRAHRAEFSQPCQTAIADMRAKIQARRAAAATSGGNSAAQTPPPAS